MLFRSSIGILGSVLALYVFLGLSYGSAHAADDELADLKRAVKELQLENRELSNRLKALEAQKADRPTEAPNVTSRLPDSPDSPAPAADSKDLLEQRVKELELGKAAQERATRLIIQESMAKTGSKINEAVTLGGAIEVLAGRSKDFSSPYRNAVKFNTAELDLEIQFNPWVIGSFIVGYDDGVGSSVFQTNRGFNTGVERINLDRAFVTIGDLTRFPIYFRAGRMTLPFGISTGVHRADVLTIDSPLTIDAFETRKNAFGFGFGFPTPPLTRTPPPVFAPRVNPVLLNPLISSFAENVIGYKPLPFRPKPPGPSFPPPKLPPFYGSVYFYEGVEAGSGNRNFDRNIVGRLGFRAQGNCGQNYDQLRSSRWCPWSFDTNLDYNSSIFDSRFLENNYRSFMNQFGRIPGLGFNAKLTFGPASLVAEWNGASTTAVFQDDVGKSVAIKPSAWQVSLGYQFDWNPWVEAIGGQGTFMALGYSRSRDLAGVTQSVGGAPSRVGFLPKSRTTLTVGEWVVDGVKVVVEYSVARDYSIAEGGTGIIGRGIFSTMTYSW
jgi:hypothetical protein